MTDHRIRRGHQGGIYESLEAILGTMGRLQRTCVFLQTRRQKERRRHSNGDRVCKGHGPPPARRGPLSARRPRTPSVASAPDARKAPPSGTPGRGGGFVFPVSKKKNLSFFARATEFPATEKSPAARVGMFAPFRRAPRGKRKEGEGGGRRRKKGGERERGSERERERERERKKTSPNVPRTFPRPPHPRPSSRPSLRCPHLPCCPRPHAECLRRPK
ncbi:MAG: hypothetical protein BJ554DRAFT_3788 [Olpidium bornovanus]|uniref:Uncharacterized protein n=1 Tax=Olpidium bornovanus TaxID=278681 RepID=A0A8H8DFE8_9FUNG|nr:MAG: hypothetical protein BJ554DRAFT_3788 [Olpidium bornovanus]